MSNTSSIATRRQLLGHLACGAIACGISGALAEAALAQAATDAQGQGRKLGWAVVGVGRLTANQILPALVKCKNARLAAVVSGDLEKAKSMCRKYGVADEAKHAYSYKNYDDIKNDETVDVVYVVLPNS